MRICLIAEGSYPYITGGVSSWIQMLVSNMEEHEFIIVAISANDTEKKTYKYEIPKNVIEIKDIYLDIDKSKRKRTKRKVKLEEFEKKIFKDFIIGEDFSWKDMFEFAKKYKDVNTVDILMSEDFYYIASEVAKEYYPHVVFNNFFWTIRSMIMTVFEVLKSENIEADIYHSVSTGYAGILGALLKYKNENSRYLLTEHGIYTREREEEIIKADWVEGYFKDNWIKYFFNLSRGTYDYADEVFSLFKRNMELQIELGCDEEKIQIIPNGIKIERFQNLPSEKEEEDYIYIGAVVRVVPIKDIKTIIQAFVLANEEIPKMKLFIIGPLDEDEEYTKECYDLVASLKNKNISFTGRVNVTDYVGKMDILALGSISEGMPLSVLEGMGAKKPYITTDVGACKDLLYGHDGLGECGIVVPVMGYAKFADAIIKLARDKDLRNKMGEIGLERVKRYYSEERFIDSYKEVYKEEV